MLSIDLIRSNREMVERSIKARGVEVDLDELIKLDDERKETQAKMDKLLHKGNEVAKQVRGKPTDEQITEGRRIKAEVVKIEELLRKTKEELFSYMCKLPNLVAEDVPIGGEENNEVVEKVPEEIPVKSFEMKSYFELVEPELVDLERATKVSGSRFVYLKGQLARLQVGLVAFVFDLLEKDDFLPVMPPVLIGREAMTGMGYMDAGEDEIYKTQDELYLVGTSEQSIGPMHMDEILDAKSLPLRYVGYSTCFRREAGSHGKDVRGILRLHQFDKIEMFSFVHPDKSGDEHELLLTKQKEIMAALELPYQIVKLATGDLGAPSAKTYDIETWIPSDNRYRETHSTSNTTDYQARRLNIRTRQADGAVEKVHMLNGTAIAMSRILIALIENHQREDGSIGVPEALRKYVPFDEIRQKS